MQREFYTQTAGSFFQYFTIADYQVTILPGRGPVVQGLKKVSPAPPPQGSPLVTAIRGFLIFSVIVLPV